MEMISGEAGVLRTALGVVLAREGIDARVRVYLWSGGVEDVVLPVMGDLGGRLARPVPVGSQVIVTFLSDRTASGMVVGTIEGLLSWRRTAAPAFTDYIQPHMQEIMVQAGALDASVTVVESLFGEDPGNGYLFASGAVVMADGRVFFVPCMPGSDDPALVRPQIWDPHSGAVHEVAWDGTGGDIYMGGCLLQDGRVFLMPEAMGSGQAHIYDPELDRVMAAGEPIATGCMGCVVMADGRVLLVPHAATSPLIYDPRADTMSTSQVVTPAELQTGMDFWGGVLLPDGRVLLVPHMATAAMVYNPADDTTAVIEADLQGTNYAGGVLLPDGRVFLVSYSGGTVFNVFFDPATDSLRVEAPAGYVPGGWRCGLLLANGMVLLLPGMYGGWEDCRIFDPATGKYAQAPELAAVAPAEIQAYGGGAVLPDGRVVLCPYECRNLVVWDPGLGVAFGRDVALSGFWNHQP